VPAINAFFKEMASHTGWSFMVLLVALSLPNLMDRYALWQFTLELIGLGKFF